MKIRIAVLLAFALMMVGAGRASADVCSDLSQVYVQKLDTLAMSMEDALRRTTDPNEQEAIRASFEMQKLLIESERDSVLASAGCLQGPIEPPTEPVDDTTGGGGADPGEGDVVTPPEVPPTEGCQDSLVAYADQLKSQGVHLNEMSRLVQAKAHELGCNFGLYNASTHEPEHINGKHQSRPLGYNKEGQRRDRRGGGARL